MLWSYQAGPEELVSPAQPVKDVPQMSGGVDVER